MIKRVSLMILAMLVLAACGGNPPAPTPSPTAAPTDAPAANSYMDSLRGAAFDPPRALADFEVPSTTGEPFKLSDHRGEVILLYFGYRTCPDFCPTTLLELQSVYADLDEPADKVKVIFVTIDPERDTLENMKQYTGAFNEDFLAVRAEGEELQALIDAFGVVAEKRVVGESALSYLFDHTASIFLIGPDGELEAQYLYGSDYRDIVHDVQLILESRS
jgi:protein SCO1/2